MRNARATAPSRFPCFDVEIGTPHRNFTRPAFWCRWSVGFVLTLLFGMSRTSWTQTPGEGLPESILREVKVRENLPRGKYVAAKEWEATSKEVGHNTGKAVSDPEAEGGKAWEAKVNRDTVLTHMLFGPYAELTPGDYVAFIRMKLLEDAGEEVVAEADACVSYAQNILTAQEVAGSDLAINRYVQVPLAFRYPGGKLECRVLWHGYASVRVDRIALYRLEGGNLSVGVKKASQPVPSGEPKDLAYSSEPRPFPDVFPRSAPPASKFLVFDIRKQLPDWQLLLFTLQGIVNRARPRLYFLFNATDEQWLDWMRKKKWITHTQTVASPQELLKQFRSVVKGMVIIDSRLPATKNVATMIASVKDGVVVSPRLARELSLPILEDLRGRWTNNVDAYRWAFDNLWSQLNHHVIACSYPDHLALRDYLVENKVFIFWISGPIDGARKGGDPTGEVRLMEQLLARMPLNMPVMSYPWAGVDVGIGEGAGVTLFAEFGKYLVGSIDCSNLSVHSGLHIDRLRQPTPPAPPPLRRDKVYVSLVISDGDNLPVLMSFNFPPLWKDRLRGQFPIGWTISPSSSLLIPDIVDYYYSTASPNDCFLGAVSGVGYTYPDSYGKRVRESDRSRVFDGFLDQTRLYMDRMDLKLLWPMGVAREDLLRRYAERIPSLQALFPDYGRRVSSYEEATYSTTRNVPVFHAVTGWKEDATREEQINTLVEGVKSITPAERPAFLHLFVWNWGADLPMLNEVLRRLGPDYVAVRPDHLGALYRQEMADKQVVLRVPQTIIGVEGQPVEFTGTIHNVSTRPLEVQLTVASGVIESSIQPTQVKLPPGEEQSLTITGLPSADQIALEVKGDSGVRRKTIVLRTVHSDELAMPLPSGASLRCVRHFEAEQLSHRSGKGEKDAEAIGGTVWSAKTGEAEPGFIVFGPYSPLDKGRYVALFRVKRTGEGAGALLTLDTCVGGGTPTTATREVSAKTLPLGKFKSFPLVFDHPGGAVETRVQWSGSASVAVDSIAVFNIVNR